MNTQLHIVSTIINIHTILLSYVFGNQIYQETNTDDILSYVEKGLIQHPHNYIAININE